MTTDREKSALTFNPDRAIKMPEEDKLGRAAFAENIAIKIFNYENECPLVLGVYGSWGYGKTSLINLVKHYILTAQQNETSKTIEMFDLSPWSYSHSDQIIEPFIREIADKFSIRAAEIHEGHKECSSILSDIAIKLNFLAAALNATANTEMVAVANLITLGLTAKDLSKRTFLKFRKPKSGVPRDPKSLSEEKEAIAKLLSNKKDFKIIFIIDDIDRLLADEIRQLFQAIKSIINLPNLIFILAMDEREVGKLISHEGFSGRDYIEKIIQIPIYVPYPDRNKFEERLSSQINLLANCFTENRWNDDRWFSIYHGGLKEILLENANLRQLYRMINQICINLEKMQMDVNPIDYIAIESIKVYHPNVYRFIYRNKLLFLGNELNIAESFSNELADKKDKAVLIEEFNKFNSHVKRLLPLLFPRFSLSEDDSVDNSESNSSWQKGQRICSGHYFENYFLQEIPNDQVSQDVVDFFIVGNQSYSAYYDKLEKLFSYKSFDNFIIRLSYGLDFSQGWQKNDLFLSLINITERYETDRPLGLDTLDNFIAGIFYRYIKSFHIQSREHVVSEIFYQAKALYFPLLIILGLQSEFPQSGNDPKSEEKEIIALLSSKWIRKVETAFMDKSLKSFKGLHFIIYYWKKWGKNDHLELFVEELNDSAILIKLLKTYIYDAGRKFNIKELFEINIADKLYMKPSLNLLDSLSVEEKDVVSFFKRSYQHFINTDEYRNLKKEIE